MMSLYERVASRGATASRRVSDHPTFSLCARLLEADPTGSYADIKKRWVAEVREDPDLIDDVLTYAFRNYYTALAGISQQEREAGPQRRTAEREKIAKEFKVVAGKIEEAMQVKALKSFLLPNGLVAWEATCGELSRYGGFLGMVAKLGKPSDPVSALPLSKLKKIAPP